MIVAVQLALPFETRLPHRFDQYHAGANQEIVHSLKACAEATGEKLIYLWGDSGLGKTHLLNATCLHASETQQSSVYLPLADLLNHEADILDGLDGLDLICIDDIDAAAGQPTWEKALFSLFNTIREHSKRLVVSAAETPTDSSLQLPDLRSRLGWGLTLRLQELNDEDKLAALTLRANHLGFDLPPQVGRYLLNRYPRDLPSLWNLLDRLDRATLAAQRKLTIPFLRDYLNENA